MNKLLTKTNRILIIAIAVLLTITVSAIILLPHGKAGLTLFLLTVFVSMVGVIHGLIIALGLTLILFFFIGSTLFWISFTDAPLFVNDIPVIYLLIWMVTLLIVSVLAGRFSILAKKLAKENMNLQEQIRTLVAVDPVTGFDNKERMFLELKLEFSRSRRYDHTFSLLLIKINFFDEFRKLYGEAELTNLLHHISEGIYESTRMSDEKFRPEQDLFALLLTDTPIETMEIVINKIDEKLRVFQLQNGKYVTLSFEFGYAGFGPTMDDHLALYEFAKEQVYAHVS